jgi:hypothetical protein
VSSCVEEKNITIVNYSSKEVSYQFRNKGETHTIGPGKTQVHNIGNVPYPGDLSSYQAVFLPKSVEMRRPGDAVYEFHDITITLEIINTLPSPLTLSCEGYMSTDPQPLSAAVSPPVSCFLYTKTPVFSIAEQIPAVIDYMYNETNNTMTVIIR